MVKSTRQKRETGLLTIMQFAPTTTTNASQLNCETTLLSWHVTAFRIKKTINRIPSPTVRDLAKVAFAPENLKIFNPFLTEKATIDFRAGVFQWLELQSQGAGSNSGCIPP